jgi:hypothetical protein
MYFRFGSVLCLAAAVSLVGVAVEKSALELRRDISRQHYRLEVLQEEHARMRLQTQQLGAPRRMIDSIEEGGIPLNRPKKRDVAQAAPSSGPLLRWQAPVESE